MDGVAGVVVGVSSAETVEMTEEEEKNKRRPMKKRNVRMMEIGDSFCARAPVRNYVGEIVGFYIC